MRLTLFRRLAFGHMAILIMAASASIYAVFSLRQFTVLTRSIIGVDNRLLEYEGKLRDAVLSEIQYERKFLIGLDKALYDRFRLFNADFNQYLADLTAMTQTPEARAILERIKQQHSSYEALLEEEMGRAKTGKPYPVNPFKKKKEALADAILEELKNLRTHAQQSTHEKIERLDQGGAASRTAVLFMALASVIMGVLMAFLITRSITRPVALLKKKTAEIAQGEFGGELNIASPPEIAELASAFDAMCRKLRELDTMKSEFFSVMSHELRTPLSSIKEGTGLLLEGVGGPLTEKQQKLLRIVAEESQRLIRLVNTMLDLSKMEAGMMTYRFEPTRLADLVERTMTELMPLAEAKKITFEAKMAEPLPLLKLDQEKILQVLRNLIGNAVKFTPEGGQVVVGAGVNNGHVQISIGDTGPGIREDDLGKIFDKYHQVQTEGRAAHGTGLGLAIAKYAVTAHGGKIWVESKPGEGSTFLFSLPV
jgi:two-component system sensor histidine kinase GlrK